MISKTADFVVMTYVTFKYPQISAGGLIHKPRISIYIPWLLYEVTSSDLRDHWFCCHDIHHVPIPPVPKISPDGSFISPEIVFIYHGY